MNRNGNSANFFSYVCNGKKLKSCLPLLEMEYLLVLDVSSMIVVLNANANIKDGEKRRSPARVSCFPC